MHFVHMRPIVVPHHAVKQTVRKTATKFDPVLLPLFIPYKILHPNLAGTAEMMLKLLKIAVACAYEEFMLLQYLDDVNGLDLLEAILDCFMVLSKPAKSAELKLQGR